MNIKDKFNNNSTVSQNPLHSQSAGLTNLSSFMSNHSQDTIDNLIFNDHLDDNQIK
ncbi:hypothetical protein [Clostridium sp. B9]|uniref:hypothetical protein n=1 Tax=Clostridium sp. B9 TaxID=3423224 RepID=UPI003D2F08F8